MGFRVLHHLNTSNLKGIAEEARLAEDLGYDGLCSEETAHDPLFPLLMAATSTSRVTLEPRVAIAFPRSPMVLAYAAMDLQNFSGGRFRLGLGTQVKGHIQRRFSTDWVPPGPRMREYVQSLHAIWDTWQSGERLAFHGKHYNFSLMTPFFSPGPSEQPPPPVFISAVNPYNCRVAGEVCEGLSLHPLCSPKYLRQVIMPNLASGAAKAGRDVSALNLSGSPFVITGPNQASIDAQKPAVRQHIAFYCSARTYLPVLETHGFGEVGVSLHEMSLKGQWEEMTSLISDEILETFAVIGGYDEVAPMLKERFGGLLNEVVFNLPESGPGDGRVLERTIAELRD